MQFMKNVSIASQCSNYMYVKKSLENLHNLLIFLKLTKQEGFVPIIPRLSLG